MRRELSIQELSRYFHLPINEAAEQLGVCRTGLKKICRQHNIHRWPARKLQSLNRMIATLEYSSVSAAPTEQARIRTEITSLKKRTAALLKLPEGFDPHPYPPTMHVLPPQEAIPHYGGPQPSRMGGAQATHPQFQQPQLCYNAGPVLPTSHPQFPYPPSCDRCHGSAVTTEAATMQQMQTSAVMAYPLQQPPKAVELRTCPTRPNLKGSFTQPNMSTGERGGGASLDGKRGHSQIEDDSNAFVAKLISQISEIHTLQAAGQFDVALMRFRSVEDSLMRWKEKIMERRVTQVTLAAQSM